MSTFPVDDLVLHLDEVGAGRPVVVLHGGGGPATVAPIAQHLAARARVLLPTLPGWDGAPRPASVRRIEDIAERLSHWLQLAGLEDVVLVGSSLGGWLAGELAVRDVGVGRVSGVVLIDSVGFDPPGQTIRDFLALDPRGAAQHSWYDAERYYVDPATIPDERRAVMAANMATMKAVAGDPYMVDPGLLGQVGTVQVPVLAIWGEADGIVSPDYGRAVADAFPAGRFAVVARAGHLPQLEQPVATSRLLDEFLDGLDSGRRP